MFDIRNSDHRQQLLSTPHRVPFTAIIAAAFAYIGALEFKVDTLQSNLAGYTEVGKFAIDVPMLTEDGIEAPASLEPVTTPPDEILFPEEAAPVEGDTPKEAPVAELPEWLRKANETPAVEPADTVESDK